MAPRRSSGADTSASKPFTNTRRPGNSPDYEPTYRVLAHRKHERRWTELVDRIGIDQAQRFYDHVASTPGAPAEGIRLTHLRGSAGRARDGWSKVHHWRVPGSATRLDYRYRNDYIGDAGDPHPVVQIIAINYASH